MVAVGVAAVIPSLTAGVSAGTAAAITIASGLLAAYIDQQLIYPGLFGKKNPKPDALEGFQISTTDPGAPRWEVYGSRAWTPCHYMWTLGIESETNGGGGGKGSATKPFTHTVRADVGLAACDGPISDLDTLYADERPFWSRQPNRAVIEDYNWTIAAGTGPHAGKLAIFCRDLTQQPFTSLFQQGDLVSLERVTPYSLTGYYEVAGIISHVGTSPSSIVLTPRRGQIPAAGTAGTPLVPGLLRRIDQGFSGHLWGTRVQANRIMLYSTLANPYPRAFDQGRFVVGVNYKFTGWDPDVDTATYKCIANIPDYQVRAFPPPPAIIGPRIGTGKLEFQLVQGRMPLNSLGPSGYNEATPGTAAYPLIVERDISDGFTFTDDPQSILTWLGSPDQVQDPTLASHFPEASSHRGIAHASLSNWNLGPHGNRFPSVTALVRPRIAETLAAAIKRICGRTMDDEMSNVELLRERNLLGYSIPGGLANGQALQPILTFHGIAMQDRGGVMTFLDERDLPVIPVATRHLNARPTGSKRGVHGFTPTRIDEDDLPERILLKYIEPAEGGDGAEGAGRRAPGRRDRGGRDTIEIDLRPLVIWPADAKRRARDLERRIRIENRRGQITLPIGYLDILPGHVLTFASNNWQHEIAASAAVIAHSTALRDILPNTVAVEVRFSGGQRATLVDDGDGALEGFPAGITTITNTIDYEAGRIELLASEALDSTFQPSITYRYEKQWFMRVSRATVSAHDFSVTCDLVSTTTDEPLPPLPRSIPGLGGPIVGLRPEYEHHVLEVPPLFYGQGSTVLIHMAIRQAVGSEWRGAIVYRSPNGIDRWTAIGQASQPSKFGVCMSAGNLPGVGSFDPGVVDWSTELLIDMPAGETLETVTTEQIGYGQNWALIGNEVIAFHEAEAGLGNEWTLRGIVRGLRHTVHEADHVDGERFVMLQTLGLTDGFTHEAEGGYAAANRTYHYRIVPAGVSVDAVETTSIFIQGKSARPAPPLLDPSMVVDGATYAEVTWKRRSYQQTTIFGPQLLLPGEFERYQVIAFDHDEYIASVDAVGVDAAIEAASKRIFTVGNPNSGTPHVRSAIRYQKADMTADGFTLGSSVVGIAVYQVGAAGRSTASDVVAFTPAI